MQVLVHKKQHHSAVHVMKPFLSTVYNACSEYVEGVHTVLQDLSNGEQPRAARSWQGPHREATGTFQEVWHKSWRLFYMGAFMNPASLEGPFPAAVNLHLAPPSSTSIMGFHRCFQHILALYGLSIAMCHRSG